jgi:transposase
MVSGLVGAMSAQLNLPLPSPISNTVVINARCLVRMEESQRVVLVAGLPVHHYQVEDSVAEAYAMVLLVEAGFAQQTEVARAFGRSERTVRRYQERYAEGGMAGLERGAGWRRGRRRIAGRRLRTIDALKQQGLSNRAVAQRLGVTEKAIRKLAGPSRSARPEQLPLAVATGNNAPEQSSPPIEADNPADSANCATFEDPTNSSRADERQSSPVSFNADAADRSVDRILAYLGKLHDAAPLFRNGSQVQGAGVLIAIPLLIDSGIFDISQKLYGGIGPAFYGLRTTLLTLLLMALLRIQRPEHLKERDPAALGRLLGLDRAPEVKTIRRKLNRMASHGCANQLGAELAGRRVTQRGHLMGFLYVDGHVRAYHGKHPISSAYVARRRMAMPATTDYWINDCAGDPLLVITGDVNAAFTQAFPNLLAQVRSLLEDRRATIVFDRGGFSAKLFETILRRDFDILTYRKGKCRRINPRRFVRRSAKLDGVRVTYDLHEQAVRFLKGKLRLRQITRLCDNGHQTQVLTSRWDLSDVEVAYRMFERWRQENFFKYMREEFLLDALVDYRIEAEDPTRTIRNPQRRALDKQLRSARAELATLERDYGAADKAKARRSTKRRLQRDHAKLGKALQKKQAHLTKLLNRRRKLPEYIQVRDLSPGSLVKLSTERKHLTNLIKMVAYQAESDLLVLLSPHYSRADKEGRTLLHELFSVPGDIRVADSELLVALAPLSSPHRNRAAAALCAILDQTQIIFPGSSLQLRFAVQPSPRLGLAFPGSPVESSP